MKLLYNVCVYMRTRVVFAHALRVTGGQIMAQEPITTNKCFRAKWTERDEAVLFYLLKRKIHDIKW